MRRHPTVQQIRQLLSSDGSWRQEAAALHLLECEHCRRMALDELEPDLSPADRGEILGKVLPFHRSAGGAATSSAAVGSDEAGSDASSPDAALSGVPCPGIGFGERLHSRLAAAELEMAAGGDLLEELKGHPTERWPELFDRDSRFLSAALAGEIIDHSRAVGYREPLRAVQLARRALELIDRLPAELYGDSLLDDLRLRAWTRVGTGYRLAGELALAESAFRHAERWKDDTPDPQEKAGYLYLLGLLRKDQRRFDEALELFEDARRLSVEIDDRDRLMQLLISTGSLHVERGDAEEALPALLDALNLIDDRTDSRVALFARSNLAHCFVELGDYAGARRIFESCRAEYAASEDSFVRLRALWMDGRIESGLGDIERAESCLTAARQGYLERGQHYDAALVSLHLAEVYARTGRSSEVKVLAEEMADEFLAQDIPAEAMAALAFFRQAVEQERATGKLVGGVARFLQRAQTDPGLKFRGA